MSPPVDRQTARIRTRTLGVGAIAVLIVLAGPSRAHSKHPKSHGELQSFYIVRSTFTDAYPGGGTDILDVSPSSHGVRVREIRLEVPQSSCPDLEILADERTVVGQSIMSLTSQDLCTIPEKNFSTVLKKSKSSFTCCSFAGSTYNVAARCGNAEWVFRLPPSERIDFKKLNNRAPEIARLWDLFNTVYAKAFGEQPGSGEQSPLPRERYAEFQNTGAALMLELISGKFDLGVGKPLSQTLAEYHGSVGWPSVMLLNKDEIPLAKYVAPYYPSMARIARIEGNVELAITPDSENGKVDRVTLVSGQPLLANGAIDAAKSWIFKWGQTSPVRAKFKFSLGCHS